MKTYTGEFTSKISFPLGGIGSGCIGLSGSGQLIDWEIFGRPNKLSFNGCSHFAIKAEADGKVLDVRILAGNYTGDRTGAPDNFGFGIRRESLTGAPHFENCEFHGDFPIAKLVLSDQHFPGRVTLTAFNPLIPLNDFDSSLPGAMFEVTVENTSDVDITYSVVLVVDNPWQLDGSNYFSESASAKRITLKSNDDYLSPAIKRDNDGIDSMLIPWPLKRGRGELLCATDNKQVSFQENWFDGSWFDALAVYFRELRKPGMFENRMRKTVSSRKMPGDLARGCQHATLAAHQTGAPGMELHFRFVIAWYVPDTGNYWDEKIDEDELKKLGLENHWRHYYATKFKNSGEVGDYLLKNFERLLKMTEEFRRVFYSSSIPDTFIEAAGANIATLKSSTCLRLEDGSFYGFEGVTATFGSCEGSCSHVWNYAYTMPFLFPQLERSMRDLEYTYNLRSKGDLSMRLMLPLGRPSHYRACADGQFGTIIKVYREWLISGDDQWLRNIWPKVKKSLEYAWSADNPDHWDPEQCGLLTGRQHHTLDMELFGPNSWLSGFYLAALEAAGYMAEAVGEHHDAENYRKIAANGRNLLNRDLFNGEYFVQKLDLKDRSILEGYNGGGGGKLDSNESILDSYWNKEHGEIKYQLGDGCIIDQMLAQWHASMVGLGDIFDPQKVKIALKSLYKYNFKEHVGEIFNPCRVFSSGTESGTVICEWPEPHYRPWCPLPYAEETMPGFEYSLAGLMLQSGLVSEAERLIKAVRDRHDGANRNPWSEMECGSNYARSMAAYSFPVIYSGFHCNMSEKSMKFAPLGNPENFSCFWSTGSAWGGYYSDEDGIRLEVSYGNLELKKLSLPGKIANVILNDKEIAFTRNGEELSFAECLSIKPGIVLYACKEK